MATPSQPSQTTSYYDEGMFMCEPCISSGGGNMCVYGSDAPVDVNDFENQEDPHSYDPSYYDRYVNEKAKALQTRSKLKIPRLTAGKPGDPFPMCAGDAVSQCFFNESGHGRVSVDNCMTAVFEPVSDNPAYQSSRNTQRMKPSQAMMLADVRTARCPYFVCNTKSMRGGNGKMSFDATDCRCSSSNTFSMQNQ
jgi:hypothetical protein